MKDVKDSPRLDWIKNHVKESCYHISEHVMRSLMAGKVSIQKVEEAILKGALLEVHVNPKRGKNAVVLGYSGETPVHVVCAKGDKDQLVILFSYIPSPPLWKDPEHRNPSKGYAMQKPLRKCFFCNGDIKPIKVGNFDYRYEGELYVIKNVPAGLCLQCGEKYLSAPVARRIDVLIHTGKYSGKEEVHVLEYI